MIEYPAREKRNRHNTGRNFKRENVLGTDVVLFHPSHRLRYSRLASFHKYTETAEKIEIHLLVDHGFQKSFSFFMMVCDFLPGRTRK